MTQSIASRVVNFRGTRPWGMKMLKSGGGWAAIKYTLDVAARVGWRRLWRAMRSKNACKTCALGMGGQVGGMRNEAGRWPEVCKKSLQAMAADMQDGIAPGFFRKYTLDELRSLSSRELEAMGRLTRPVYAGPGDRHFRVVSWDEALVKINAALRVVDPQQAFFYMSGRSSNEAAFLLQLFARLYGTNHVNNCSYYCHQASGVGLNAALGSGTATVDLDDVENADLFFLIGGNPASNHPRLMRTLMQVRRRGGEVIVINPVKETGLVNFRVPSDVRSLLYGSEIASLYVQPHIGGDIALLTGVAKALLERGAVDAKFIAEATEGWEAWRAHMEAAEWEEIERCSGVERAVIEQVAERYARAKNVIFGWTMGITHHEHGVQNVQTIVNLALMRGMVGRTHAGLLPIRGHSNVQGVGSMGVTPKLKEAVFERLQTHFGVKLPETAGHDTMACLEAAQRGEIRAGVCLGGNLYAATPDLAFARRALSKLDTLVYLTTTLNLGHVHGMGRETLILPVLARDEETQATTQESMFNYVRFSDGGPPRHEGPRSEVRIVAEIAERVLGRCATASSRRSAVAGSGTHDAAIERSAQESTASSRRTLDSGTRHLPAERVGSAHTPVDWQAMRNHADIRRAIAKIVPGFEELEHIDRTKREFHVAGRTFHTPRFATANGKARFHVHPIPFSSQELRRGSSEQARSSEYSCQWHPSCRADGELRLMTVRSEGQFNTVVYDEEDLYRGQVRRDVILINPADMERLGLKEDQLVTVRGPAGELANILARPFDIRAGNALMYFPEANALLSTTVDPASRTPCYKSVPVTLTPQAQRVTGPRVIDLKIEAGGPAPRKLNAC